MASSDITLPPPPPPPPLPTLSVQQTANNGILPPPPPPPPVLLPSHHQQQQQHQHHQQSGAPLVLEKNNNGNMDFINPLLLDIQRGVKLRPCQPQTNKYNTLPHKPHGVNTSFINSENNTDDDNIKPMKNQLQAELCSTLQRRQKQNVNNGGDNSDQPKKPNFVTPKNSTINAIYTQLQLKEIEDAERAIQALNATLPRRHNQGPCGNGNGYGKKESTDAEESAPPPKLMISHGKPNFVRVTPICRLPQLSPPQPPSPSPSPQSTIQPSRSSSSSSTSSIDSSNPVVINTYNATPTISANNTSNNVKIPPIKPITINKIENKFGEVMKTKTSLTPDNNIPSTRHQWSSKNSLPTSGRSSQLSSPLPQRKNSTSSIPSTMTTKSTAADNNNSDNLIQQAIRQLKSSEYTQNSYLNMEKKSHSPELNEFKNLSMPSSGTQSPSLISAVGAATTAINISSLKNKFIETTTTTAENNINSTSTDIITSSTQFNQKEIKEKFEITTTTNNNNQNNNWSQKSLPKNGSHNILLPSESPAVSSPRKANVFNPQIYQHSSNISSSNIQHLKKTFDTTATNFNNNKPIVSFSKDLGATPNRYPDMVKVIKTVASSSSSSSLSSLSSSSTSATATVISSNENGHQQQNNNDDDGDLIKGNLFFSDLKFIINDNGEVIKDSIKTEYRKQ